jgi:hypothetical protein
VLETNALPIATLEAPVVLELKALFPIAVFQDPVKLGSSKALSPNAVLYKPKG